MAKKQSSKSDCDKNEFVGIAGAIGGISVGVVAVLGIFARDHMWVAAPVVGSLALMGIFLGYYATKRK